MKPRRIVIGVDGSDGSRAAQREGLRLAAGLNAVVTLVSVIKAPPVLLGDPYYQRAVGEALKHARGVLAEAVGEAEAAGIMTDYDLVHGDAAAEIVALADVRGADMIVLGSRGLGGVVGTLLGSVSRDVVHHARVPVLVVRADAAATTAA